MEENQRLLKLEQTEAIYSDLSIAKESATIICVWQRLKYKIQMLVGKVYWEDEVGEASNVPNCRLVAQGRKSEAGLVCDWFGEDIWLSMAGSWVGSGGEH